MEETDNEPMFCCESCGKDLFEGDLAHAGADGVYLCSDCAPTLQDLRDNVDMFADPDDLPMTAEAAAEIVSSRLASGLKLTDKLVSAI